MHNYQQQKSKGKKMLLKLFTFSLLLSLCLSNPDFTTLLSFKISADSSSSLPWSSSSYPCSWLGVTCHPITHRVTKLILNNFNLTGSMQTLTRLTQLRHLSLHHNSLSFAPSFSSWPKLKHLYLSHNEFSGEFPAGVSTLHRLLRLDLSYNNFSGQIPMTELTQLPHLLTLLLEFNSFNGTLNSSTGLSAVSPLAEFNVSENALSGKIPDYLLSFPVSSFAGNSRLCGKPLPLDCYNGRFHSKPVAGDDENGKNRFLDMKKKVRNSVEMMIISVVVVVILILFIVTWCCYRFKEKKMKVKKWYNGKYGGATPKGSVDDQEMVCFEGCKGFDKVDELLMASAEMLGKGIVGTTYKVEIEGGDVVVKRVRLRESSARAKKREIDGYLRENIGGLRNPNVLSLRAFCCSKDELLLAYDFLPNGSLFTILHGNRGPGRTPLDWNTRLKVALGSAQGLAFLHSHKLVHGNLTSSNIIIDNSGNPCISDIGLNLLLQIPSSINNPYRAPELVQVHTTHNNQSVKSCSKKCDVYSFGVILLEILTGKTAWTEGEGDLVKWVKGMMKQDNWIWEVFDFEMLRYKEMEGEMKALLEVALLCLVSSPNQRPEMILVKKMIDDIKVRDMGSTGEFQESISNGSLTSGSSSFSESV